MQQRINIVFIIILHFCGSINNNMPIINTTNSYFIHENGSFEIYEGGGPAVVLDNWDTKNYWLLNFINSAGFFKTTIEEIATKEIHDCFLNGSLSLLLCNVSEAYHYIVDDIYKELIIKQKIPISSIVLLTNSADINLEIDAISKKYNLPKLKAYHMMSFEFDAKHHLLKHPPGDFQLNTLEIKKYTKKFLSFNGVWRPHRILLAALLKGLNILDKGHISLNIVDNYPPTELIFDTMLNYLRNHAEGRMLLINNEEEIKKLDRIILDGYDLHSRISYHNFTKSLYENTYFSIVTETLCCWAYSQEGVTLGRALSEKTFKPILLKHPFLLVSVPRSLQLLKDMGYKTFDECIDESYDDEFDDGKRIYMVAKEVERLCNLSAQELENFLNTCRKITDYNFEVLKNKKNFVYEKT